MREDQHNIRASQQNKQVDTQRKNKCAQTQLCSLHLQKAMLSGISKISPSSRKATLILSSYLITKFNLRRFYNGITGQEIRAAIRNNFHYQITSVLFL